MLHPFLFAKSGCAITPAKHAVTQSIQACKKLWLLCVDYWMAFLFPLLLQFLLLFVTLTPATMLLTSSTKFGKLSSSESSLSFLRFKSSLLVFLNPSSPIIIKQHSFLDGAQANCWIATMFVYIISYLQNTAGSILEYLNFLGHLISLTTKKIIDINESEWMKEKLKPS